MRDGRAGSRVAFEAWLKGHHSVTKSETGQIFVKPETGALHIARMNSFVRGQIDAVKGAVRLRNS